MTGFIDPLDPEPIVEDEYPGAVLNEPGTGASDLEQVRALVLRAHPEVVPELVTGESVAALLASVGPASEAYAALVERIAPTVTAPAVPRVPAGAVDPIPLDPDRLPIAEKLRRGIRERAHQHTR